MIVMIVIADGLIDRSIVALHSPPPQASAAAEPRAPSPAPLRAMASRPSSRGSSALRTIMER